MTDKISHTWRKHVIIGDQCNRILWKVIVVYSGFADRYSFRYSFVGTRLVPTSIAWGSIAWFSRWSIYYSLTVFRRLRKSFRRSLNQAYQLLCCWRSFGVIKTVIERNIIFNRKAINANSATAKKMSLKIGKRRNCLDSKYLHK